jgi:hypothetical protein
MKNLLSFTKDELVTIQVTLFEYQQRNTPPKTPIDFQVDNIYVKIFNFLDRHNRKKYAPAVQPSPTAKCGECLIEKIEVVTLVDGICPKCGADYRHSGVSAPASTSKRD